MGWLLGPRDWTVVDDGETKTADDIKAIMESTLLDTDEVLYRGLRKNQARCLAHDLRHERELRLSVRRPAIVMVAESPEVRSLSLDGRQVITFLPKGAVKPPLSPRTDRVVFTGGFVGGPEAAS